jgi:hypothetical protein
MPAAVTDLDEHARLLRDSLSLVNGDQPADATHSWTPIDLVAAGTQPPDPPTISGLVYPGQRHLFSGKPEALKSWAAMILCADLIHQDQSVLYVDFEMGKRDTYARLQDLGLTDDAIHTHFLYIEPEETFRDNVIQTDVAMLLLQHQVRLVVIDAFLGALRVHGLDPNKGIDIETFGQTVVNPLRAHGAAVVILDHLPKDPNNQGIFAIGSERKVGIVEVHLGFEVVARLSRGGHGKAKILTHKDRPGYLPRPRAAELELTSNPAGRITWKLIAPDNPDVAHPFRPTHLMEKVSRHLEEQSDPISLNQIEQTITGKVDFIRKATERLVIEGHAGETAGPRNARLFTSIRPYREASDPHKDDLVPPRPDLVPDEVILTSSPSSPPLRGDGVNQGRSQAPKTGRPRPDEQDEVNYHDEPPPTEPAYHPEHDHDQWPAGT